MLHYLPHILIALGLVRLYRAHRVGRGLRTTISRHRSFQLHSPAVLRHHPVRPIEQ